MSSLSIGGISISKDERNETLLVSVSDKSQEEFENSLRDLLEWLTVLKIKEIVFISGCNGGNLDLPDWFIEECRQFGIHVEVRSSSPAVIRMTRNDLLTKFEPWGWSPRTLDLGIRANFRCEYCGRSLISSVDDHDAWQVDHILPRIAEREEFWNLALSCRTCNCIKRHSIPTEPIDPKSNRAHAIDVVRSLINERRAKKQIFVDVLRKTFLCVEWSASRQAIIEAQQAAQPVRRENAAPG